MKTEIDNLTDYIVDTSVVVQHLITDTHTASVDTLFAQLDKTIRLNVPEFCLAECTNVLWKEVRFRGMPPSEAESLANDMTSLQLRVLPIHTLLQRALQIGLWHKLAVYDSIYIALAVHLGYALITVDNKQETAARAMSITLKPITDFPPMNP